MSCYLININIKYYISAVADYIIIDQIMKRMTISSTSPSTYKVDKDYLHCYVPTLLYGYKAQKIFERVI